MVYLYGNCEVGDVWMNVYGKERSRHFITNLIRVLLISWEGKGKKERKGGRERQERERKGRGREREIRFWFFSPTFVMTIKPKIPYPQPWT